ncbi:MAG: hypothetical protein EBQ97_04575 [Bacteroidetes bacterium]|nr:hypothetical protein [Bacteroidota bacterium]
MPPQQPIQNQAPVAAPAVTPLPDKFTVTIKTFLTYGLVVTAVSIVLSSLFIPFSPSLAGANVFSFGAVIFGIIFQGIAWIVIGLLFAVLFPFVRDVIKGIPGLNAVITSTYDLLWKPYLFLNVVFFLFGLLAVFGISTFARGNPAAGLGAILFAFITSVISLIVNLYAYNWFAKTVSNKLAAYYPWN